LLIVAVRSANCPKMNGPLAAPTLHDSPRATLDVSSKIARNVFRTQAVRFATVTPPREKIADANLRPVKCRNPHKT